MRWIENPMIRINFHPSPRDLRIFCVGQIVVVAIITAGLMRRGGSPQVAAILMAASMVLGLIGAVQPSRVRWFYVGWMIAVFPVGWCISQMLLAAVFGFVIIPLGLLLKCLGIDPLNRRFDSKQASYWTHRDATRPANRYFRQF